MIMASPLSLYENVLCNTVIYVGYLFWAFNYDLLILFFVTFFLVYQIHKTETQGALQKDKEMVLLFCVPILREKLRVHFNKWVLEKFNAQSLLLTVMMMKSIY